MIKLGVNIDHVATLRQARGTLYPSVTDAADCCVAGGAAGITVHLREDRRHIQDADVYALRGMLTVPLNLEMAVASEIMAVALEVLPDEVCLVPEKRQELTTEGGLDVHGLYDTVASAVRKLSGAGIAVSLFIDPHPRQIEAAAQMGAPIIELHTGTFCEAKGAAAEAELRRLVTAAELAHLAGIQVNAGHGINLDNIGAILEIPYLDTLNIGHSIVSRAVFDGMQAAVREMLDAIRQRVQR